jgi:hypothetical protein
MSKKKTKTCKKCGAANATHYVATGKNTMDGPFCAACAKK